MHSPYSSGNQPVLPSFSFQ